MSEVSIKEIRRLLDESDSPVFLFDDDPDGLCSFLLLYRYKGCGNGIIIKNSPYVTEEIYAKKVEKYGPDLIVVLDKPHLEDDFAEHFHCPIIWIDHHGLQDPSSKNIFYYNPLQKSSKATPTTHQCWKIVKQQQRKENYKDSWIAATGCVSDWFFIEDVMEIFNTCFPKMYPQKYTTAPDILFSDKSDLGKLIKIIYFNLKGPLKEVEKRFKILTRIEDPHEILEGSSPRGKFILKQYNVINSFYESLKNHVVALKNKSKFLIAIIPQNTYSFSSELSNEIFYKFPDKIVIIGRSSSGYTKGSIRTSYDINLPEIIEESLVGLDGYGGGHKQACGFRINDSDFEIFIEKFKSGCKERMK